MATKLGTAYISVDADFSAFNRKLALESRKFGKGIDLDPRSIKGFDRLGKSMANARSDADGLGDSTRNIKVDRSAVRGVDKLGGSLRGARGSSEGLHGSLLRAKLVLGLMAVPDIASGLSAGAAGAVALTSSLAPLAGSLAALPVLASTAAQAIATIGLAKSGIGDTVKAAFDAQASSGKDAAKSMEDVAAKAEAVKSAERSLSDAHRQSKYAQEEVNLARRQAVRDLVDLKDASDDARISETGSEIALKRARAALKKEIGSGGTQTDLDEAINDVRAAEEALDQSRKGRSRTAADLTTAEKQGINRAPQVVQAERAKADAQRQVADAQRQVATAQRQMSKSAGTASAATSKFEEEMAKLSPEAQAFARQIIALKPAFDGLRASAGRRLFPGLGEGITSAQRNLPVLNRLLEDTGASFGDLGRDAGALVGSPAFGRDLGTIGQRNARYIGEMGDGSLNLARALVDLTVAAGPFTDWLVRSGVGWTENIAATAQAGRETGRTAAYLERTRATMERLTSTTGHLAGGLRGVGRAGTPLGDDMWRGIDRTANRFDQWANSARGQNSLKQWFDSARVTGNQLAGVLREAQAEFVRLRGEGKSFTDAFIISGSDVFAKFLEHGAEAIARHIPTIVGAFVRGFLNSNIWGKLVIGGWLLSKFRLWPALFRRMGAANGASWAAGFGGAAKVAAPAAGAAAGVGVAGGAATGAVGAKTLFGPKGETLKTIVPGPENAPKSAGRLRGFFGALGPTARLAGKVSVGYAALSGVDAAFGDKARQLSAAGKINNFFSGATGLAKPTDSTRLFQQKMREALTKPFAGGDPKQAGFAQFINRQIPSLNADANRVLIRMRKLKVDVDRVFGPRANVQLKANLDPAQAVKAIRTLRTNFNLFKNHSTGSVREVRSIVAQNMRAIAQTMDVNSAGGRRAVRRNFSLAMGDVRDLMRDGIVTADAGAKEIRRLMVGYLGSFGFKAGDAKLLIKNYGVEGAAKRARGKGTPGRSNPTAGDVGGNRLQRGGPINIGSPSGDSVPAMLERDEYVVNRKAVKAVGVDRLNALNFGHAPRFQKGGHVGGVQHLAPGGIVGIPGEPGEYIHKSILADVLKLKRKYKLDITDGYAASGHAAGGEHPKGLAIDAGPDFGAGGSWGLVDKLAAWAEPGGKPRPPFRWVGYNGDPNHGTGNHIHLSWGGGGALGDIGGALGAAAPKIKRLIVDGPDGGPRAMTQASVDIARAGAQRVVDAAAAESGGGTPEGSESISAGTYDGPLDRTFPSHRVGTPGATLSHGQARSLATKAGLPGEMFARIAKGESNYQPGVISNDGGFGLWQMTPRVQGAETVSAWQRIGSYFNPWKNALQAKYLYERASSKTPNTPGFPWFGTKFLEQGGLAQMLQQGGASMAKAAKKAPFKQTGMWKGTPQFNQSSKYTPPPPGVELGSNIKKFEGLDAWLVDQESLYSSDQSFFGLDDILSQPEVDALVNRAGGIRGAIATQLNLVKDAILPDSRLKVKAFEKVVERRKARVAKLVADIKAASEKHRKIGETEAKDQKAFAKKKKPSAADKKKRAAEKKKHAEQRAGLVADNKGRRKELQSLTGMDAASGEMPDMGKLEQSPEDSLIGSAVAKRDAYRTSIATDPGWENLLRPSELPAKLRDADFRIAELIKNGATKPDNTDGEAAASEKASLLEELLRQSNLRTAVSERAYGVFKDVPRYGGTFHTGGTVPGPASQERMAVLRGQETVRTVEQERDLQAGSEIRVVLEDRRTTVVQDDRVVRQIVHEETRGMAVTAGRFGGGR